MRRLISEVVQSLIALCVVVAFCTVLALSIVHGLPTVKEGDQGMYLLIGALNTALGTILQTYFRQRDSRSEDRPPPQRKTP